jgi:hypothetical protein
MILYRQFLLFELLFDTTNLDEMDSLPWDYIG